MKLNNYNKFNESNSIYIDVLDKEAIKYKQMLKGAFEYIKKEFKGEIDKRYYIESYLEEDEEDIELSYNFYTLEFNLDYKTSVFNELSNKQHIDDFCKDLKILNNTIKQLKEVLSKLNINDVRLIKSGDEIKVGIELFADYFEDNITLLNSLKGISKYNL